MGNSAKKKYEQQQQQITSSIGQTAQKVGGLVDNPFAPGEEEGLRARAISPIQASYADDEREINRARSLGGAGGAPNFIAAKAKMAREKAGSLSDAMQNVNTAISSEGFNRKLQAAGTQGQLLGTQKESMGEKPKGGFWSTLGNVGLGIGSAFLSDEDEKTDIRPIDEDEVMEGVEDLPLFSWKYKGDKERHIGPMAQHFKKKLGIGDGKTIHMADIAGITLAANKKMLKGRS